MLYIYNTYETTYYMIYYTYYIIYYLGFFVLAVFSFLPRLFQGFPPCRRFPIQCLFCQVLHLGHRQLSLCGPKEALSVSDFVHRL